jgi:hypothetical protein
VGRASKPYSVRTFRVGSDGALAEVGQPVGTHGGLAVRVHATSAALFVQVDDSSTGYSAYVDAFRVDESTGQVVYQGAFASRGGGFGTGPATLMATEVQASGRFLYELSNARTGAIVVTHVVGADGRLTRAGEAAVPSGLPIEALAHPSERFLHVLARETETRAALHTYAVDAATGLLQPMQSVELAGTFSSRRLGRRLGAVHPSGRALYLSASDAIVAVAVDPATGRVGAIQRNPGSRMEGTPAVDPLGRFLYLSTTDFLGAELRGYEIGSDVLTLTETGARIAGGGGDLRVINAP